MTNLFTYFSKKSLSPDNGPIMARHWPDNGPAFFRHLLSLLFCLFSIGVGSAWGAAGNVLKTYNTNSNTFVSGYSRQSGDNFNWWGQKGYYGANSSTNHAKLLPTATDLPVVKAHNSSATTKTTGLYYLYTTEAVSNVGAIQISFSANSGSSTVNAYVVSSSTKAASGSATWTKLTLLSTSSSAQGANVATSGTYTFVFPRETSAKYYGVVFVTSSYWRATGLTMKLIEGSPAPTSVVPGTIGTTSFGLTITDAQNINNYDICFKTNNTAPTATTAATTTTTSKTPTISSGVSASTEYYVWVRSVKTVNSVTYKSAWVAMSPASLTTLGASYTVVWTINPAAGGSLSTTSGTSTTVTPDDAYTYGDPAYTVTTGAATVSQSTNTFTATPSANCTIRINMVEKPKYTVTYNAGTGTCGTDSWTQPSYGASTTLPTATAPATCTGYSFAGWCTSSAGDAEDNTSSPGTILEAGDSYTPTDNITLYAVYTKTVSGGGSTTAHLTETEMRTNLNSSSTAYGDASETSYDDTSDGIVWSGHFSANSGGYWVQLRQNATPAYLKISAGGNISQVKVTVTSASNKSGGQYDMEDGYNVFGSSINLYLSTANVVGDENANVVATAATNTTDTYQTLTLTPSPATNDELYILSSGACRVWLVDVTYSSSTTYYMTNLVCCTPLASINGSVLWTYPFCAREPLCRAA